MTIEESPKALEVIETLPTEPSLNDKVGLRLDKNSNDKNSSQNSKRPWLDYLTAFGAIIAAFGAIATAVLGFWQDKISENTFVNSQRAFVYFAPPNTIFNDETSKIIITVGMGNSGETPTQHLMYETSCIPTADNHHFTINPMINKMVSNNASIGPKVVLSPIICQLKSNGNGSFVNENGDSSETFVVIGRALYQDMFQPWLEHETRFCFAVSGFQSDAQAGNTLTTSLPCGHYNCSDDECKIENWPFTS